MRLAGGAVAAGVISPDGSRRVVQHLEGGIIASLEVKDGDRVAAGQTLVRIESVQADTAMRGQLHRYRTLLAMRARLTAEQEGRAEIEFPPELLVTGTSAELKTVLDGQRTMFETRRTSDRRQREILRRRIEQSQHQIKALEAQAASTSQQLELIAEELKGKRYLLQKELIRKSEVLSLERARAEIEGRRGEYLGMISRAEQQIGETEVQLLALDAARQDEVSEQMDKVRVELADVTEKLQLTRDVLARTTIAAPISGTVVNLRFKTLGGVIKAGDPILDIVPIEETLLIEARISPVDVDVVHPGLPAQVHLTAFSRWELPRIDGLVKSVSADAMVDQTTGQTYYLAKVEVNPSELEQFKRPDRTAGGHAGGGPDRVPGADLLGLSGRTIPKRNAERIPGDLTRRDARTRGVNLCDNLWACPDGSGPIATGYGDGEAQVKRRMLPNCLRLQ